MLCVLLLLYNWLARKIVGKLVARTRIMNIINLKGSHLSSPSVYFYSVPIYCFDQPILTNHIAPPVERGATYGSLDFPLLSEKGSPRISANINHRVYQMSHNANSNLMTPSFFCMTVIQFHFTECTGEDIHQSTKCNNGTFAQESH